MVTCEDKVENNSDLMMEMFNRLADYLKCHHVGALMVPFTTTPDALGDEVKEQAFTFAKDVLLWGPIQSADE